MDSKSQQNEIIQLVQDALNLANAAVHFDKSQPPNLIGACDYYDKCLLSLDEVLNKLPQNSEEWKKLIIIRQQYDDRMELLRERENFKFSLSAAMGGSLDHHSKTTTKTNKTSTSSPSRKKISKLTYQDETNNLTDFDIKNKKLEIEPGNMIELPYWQLRNIKTSIISGGFITNSIFIPKRVWFQSEVKLTGVSAKTTAFQIIINSIAVHIETLYMNSDLLSLEFAASAITTGNNNNNNNNKSNNKNYYYHP